MLSGVTSNRASEWASSLFARLDTQTQGYIDRAGIQSALSSISDGSDSSSSADDVFTRLDLNSNGKVTQDEMTTVLQNLLQSSQINRMRMNGGPPPPPPPPANDAGFTKEELTSQLEEIGTSDSKRAALISSIIQNFDKAHADGDGKVSFEEAMAYDQANRTSTSTVDTAGDAWTAAGKQNKDAEVMMQIMRLMQAYQVFSTGLNQSGTEGQFSISA